jgi:tetratricopeptide (TPR) repeat protein
MKSILNILLGFTLAVGSLHAQSALRNPVSNLWNDREFVNAFTGSYAILSEYEPPISNEEKEVLRGLLNAIKANPRNAIRQLEPQIKPKTSAAFDFILANLFFQEGNNAKAENYYQRAIKKYPSFRRAYKNLGLLQVQAGNYNGAVKTLSKAMELGEVDGRSYGLLGYGYLTQQLYYPSEAAYRQAILLQPDVLDWKLGLARCLMETERYTDAIALFDTLIKLDPNNADYWLLQSNAYIGNDNSMAAARNIEVARRMGKADLSTLNLLGDIYINNDAADLALDAYLAAVKIAQNTDSKSLIRASEIFTRTNNLDEAKTMIASTRQRFGSNLDKQSDLKLLTLEAKIARAEGENETAITVLNQIIERDALNGEALIELANCYVSEGDLAKAITRFEQAEKIEASERKALIAHAQALVSKADYKAALPLLRRAIYMQPDQYLEDYVQRIERAARNKG